MSEEDPNVEIDFDVNDRVTPKLSRMERGVLRLGGVVDGLSQRFMGFATQAAGLAGFLAIGPAIQGAKRYIDRLDDMGQLTGIASDRLAGMQNTLEGMGVDANIVDSVLGKMVKRGQRLNEGQKAMVQIMKRYGVEMKGGPEASLLSMSKLMEKGKLDAGGLQRILGLSSIEASKLSGALENGPEALKKAMEEATKKNAAFADISSFSQWQDASDRIGIAWNRMTATVLIKLAPALTKLADKIEGSIDKWTAGAERFGNYLAAHMDEIIAKAKSFAKIMLVTNVMHRMGISAGGVLVGAGRGVSKIGQGLSAGWQVFSMGASKGGLGVIGQMVSGLFKLRPIIGMLTKFGPIGIAIGIIVAMFRALEKNIGGIGDRLKTLFGTIWDKLKGIGASLARLFSGDGPLGKFMDFAGVLFLNAVERLGQALSLILTIVQKIIDAAGYVLNGGSFMDRMRERNEWIEAATKSINKAGLTGKARQDAVDRMNRRAEQILAGKYSMNVDSTTVAVAKPKPPKAGTKGPEVYQDFRGSRFDITQEFAEGFDPDRIAVAFANDLASIGERKVQSGFSPLFTVR